MFTLLWIAFCVLVGWYAQKKGKNFALYTLLSVFLSPLVGLIILLIVGDKEPKREKKDVVDATPLTRPDFSQFESQASMSNQVSQRTKLDELKEYKELLDIGVITQEEFEKKKKELLGT